MKLRQIIAGLATASLLGCTTIKPHAWIDLAYVPQRINDSYHENELKTEIGASLESSLQSNKDITAIVGGDFRTYITPGFPYMKSINKQEYDIFLQLILKDIELYARHNCNHPVNEEQVYVWDKDGRGYVLNGESITEIGVKLKW